MEPVQERARRAAGVLPERIRPRTRLHWLVAIVLGAGLVLMLLALLGVLVDAVADYLGIRIPIGRLGRAIFGRADFAGVALIGIEEAGIPLPVSGDLLIMFSAIRVPRDFAAWGTLAAAIEASVLIGSSVLFAASRRWGRRLIHGEVGEAMHLTPDRVARAEGWFRRWGIWAVIFGRHVPGFRVATTVVAASFGVRFPVFLAGVTISAGVWVAAFMTLGLLIGPRAERLLGAHHTTRLVVLGAAMGIGIVYVAGRLGWKRLRPGAGRPPSTAARRQ